MGDRREGVPTDVDVEERRGGPVSNDRAPSQLLTSSLLPLNDESDSCVFLCIGGIEVVKHSGNCFGLISQRHA